MLSLIQAIQLLNFSGVIIGFLLLGFIEYAKRRIKKGPLGDFYSLYSHRYITSVEFGIIFLTISFFISSFSKLEQLTAFDILRHFLLVLAMIILALSGKIFLQEVERMLRHREKEKKRFEKIVSEKSKLIK